ncbi:MAG: ATP synthase subunit I [Panacagrimonas sp.]
MGSGKKWLHLRGVKLAWAVCLTQLLITLIAASIVGLLAEMAAVKASLYGGLIAIVPTAYMGLRVYLRRNSDEPKDVLGSFYRGEIGKFALTALMFFFGVKMFGTQFLPLLATYMVCLIAYPAVMVAARID